MEKRFWAKEIGESALFLKTVYPLIILYDNYYFWRENKSKILKISQNEKYL